MGRVDLASHLAPAFAGSPSLHRSTIGDNNSSSREGETMKPELALLLWAVLLTFVQMLVAVTGATLQVGLPALAGNREGLAPCTGWAGRASRAHHYMLESLAMFVYPLSLPDAPQK